MVILDNGKLTVKISELGAEIRSVTLNGEERFWNGDPSFWSGVAPVLFPICGGLKNDKYTVDGKEYTLSKHGFARKSTFAVERQNKTSAVFLLTENEETLKQFPWEFDLRIKYTLAGEAIKVEYDVTNKSDSCMYAAIGSHEAYACPEGVEDYDIIFERKETLKSFILEGNSLSRQTETVLFESDTLPLYNKYFEVDALVFADVKSRFVSLRNRKTGKTCSLNFNGFDYLLIWTKPNAGYVCLEPWTCLPDFVDSDGDITLKTGMSAVLPKTQFKKEHTIYFK